MAAPRRGRIRRARRSTTASSSCPPARPRLPLPPPATRGLVAQRQRDDRHAARRPRRTRCAARQPRRRRSCTDEPDTDVNQPRVLVPAAGTEPVPGRRPAGSPPFGTPVAPGAQAPVVSFGALGGEQGQSVTINPTPQHPRPSCSSPAWRPAGTAPPATGGFGVIGSPTPGVVAQPTPPGTARASARRELSPLRPSYNDEGASRVSERLRVRPWRTSNRYSPRRPARTRTAVSTHVRPRRRRPAALPLGLGSPESGDRQRAAVLGGRAKGRPCIAACPITPVRVTVRGRRGARHVERRPAGGEASASGRAWAGRSLRAWDRGTGVALGAGFSDATRQRLDELRWPKAVPAAVPGQAHQPTRAPTAQLAGAGQPARLRAHAAGRAVRRAHATAARRRCRPFAASTPASTGSGSGSASLGLAVRRDARYLNWKFIEPPHVRYQAAVLRRGDEVAGYVVYRHLREPQGRVTQIVDFLADPSDERAIATLAAVGGPGSAPRGFGQDPLLRHPCRVPPPAAASRLLRREVGRRSSSSR